MTNKVLIIGAGGLAKQCLSTLRERTNYIFTFYDSVSKDPNDFGHSSTSILDPSLYEYYAVCLGDPKYRESFANTITLQPKVKVVLFWKILWLNLIL